LFVDELGYLKFNVFIKKKKKKAEGKSHARVTTILFSSAYSADTLYSHK
jgi:hypothetical protein